jgi:LPXTG-motif cell wall-anchored protein
VVCTTCDLPNTGLPEATVPLIGLMGFLVLLGGTALMRGTSKRD